MPKTRTLLTLVLLPLLVFLVACGGDDDDAGSTSSNQPSTGNSGGSGSTSGSSNSSNSNSSSDSSNSDADGAEILANCPELLSMFGAFSSGAFANPGAGNVDEDLEAAAQVFQDAAANAPDEIQADMQVLADAFTGFYTAINDLGIDFSNPASFAALSAEQQAQLQEALESFSGPELEEASANLDAYFTEHCGS
ncbi:MAG TPA: hypothetical protein VFS30_13160 [Dehalococcoidia bacterium]|nr:hypothetical protein [Dehalococcoidia bacterium]